MLKRGEPPPRTRPGAESGSSVGPAPAPAAGAVGGPAAGTDAGSGAKSSGSAKESPGAAQLGPQQATTRQHGTVVDYPLQSAPLSHASSFPTHDAITCQGGGAPRSGPGRGGASSRRDALRGLDAHLGSLRPRLVADAGGMRIATGMGAGMAAAPASAAGQRASQRRRRRTHPANALPPLRARGDTYLRPLPGRQELGLAQPPSAARQRARTGSSSQPLLSATFAGAAHGGADSTPPRRLRRKRHGARGSTATPGTTSMRRAVTVYERPARPAEGGSARSRAVRRAPSSPLPSSGAAGPAATPSALGQHEGSAEHGTPAAGTPRVGDRSPGDGFVAAQWARGTSRAGRAEGADTGGDTGRRGPRPESGGSSSSGEESGGSSYSEEFVTESDSGSEDDEEDAGGGEAAEGHQTSALPPASYPPRTHGSPQPQQEVGTGQGRVAERAASALAAASVRRRMDLPPPMQVRRPGVAAVEEPREGGGSGAVKERATQWLASTTPPQLVDAGPARRHDLRHRHPPPTTAMSANHTPERGHRRTLPPVRDATTAKEPHHGAVNEGRSPARDEGGAEQRGGRASEAATPATGPQRDAATVAAVAAARRRSQRKKVKQKELDRQVRRARREARNRFDADWLGKFDKHLGEMLSSLRG